MYRCGTTNLTRVKEYDLAHALCICVGALSGETNMCVGLIIVINPHTISIGHMSFSLLTLDPSPTSPCMSLFWMQHEASQFTRCSKRGGQCCRRPLPSKELNCLSIFPSFTSPNLAPLFSGSLLAHPPLCFFIYLIFLHYSLRPHFMKLKFPMVLLVVICDQTGPCPSSPGQSSQKLVTNEMANMCVGTSVVHRLTSFFMVFSLIYNPLVTNCNNEWCARQMWEITPFDSWFLWLYDERGNEIKDEPGIIVCNQMINSKL
jgi:hypothetical protein